MKRLIGEIGCSVQAQMKSSLSAARLSLLSSGSAGAHCWLSLINTKAGQDDFIMYLSQRLECENPEMLQALM